MSVRWWSYQRNGTVVWYCTYNYFLAMFHQGHSKSKSLAKRRFLIPLSPSHTLSFFCRAPPRIIRKTQQTVAKNRRFLPSRQSLRLLFGVFILGLILVFLLSTLSKYVPVEKLIWNYCSHHKVSQLTCNENQLTSFCRSHSFSAYTKSFEKLTFLTRWYEHVGLRIRGKEMLVFRKILLTH